MSPEENSCVFVCFNGRVMGELLAGTEEVNSIYFCVCVCVNVCRFMWMSEVNNRYLPLSLSIF